MAQVFADFESDTVGSLPTDWVRTWATSDSVSVELLGGSNVLEFNGAAAFDRNAIYYSPVSASTEQKLLTDFVLTDQKSQAIGMVALRGNIAAAESREGYTLFIRDALTLNRTLSGSETSIASATKTLNLDTVYRLRFEVTGTNPVNLKARIWEKSEAEPATWDIDFDDSDATRVNTAGYVHLGNVGAYSTNYDNTGIGTDGDPAPTSENSVSFTLTNDLGGPTTPAFNQTITLTTTNWGAEDPTSVDITDSADNTITLSLTATATADEYTFTMPTISETEGTSISGLLSGDGTIRVYSATGDDVSQSTTISYGAVWENVATLESGFNTEPTSQLTPSPVAGDQLAGQAEVEFLTNGNINADEGVWSILHVQASTGTIYTHSLNTAAIEDVAGVDISVPRLGRAKVKANVGIRAHKKVSAFKL